MKIFGMTVTACVMLSTAIPAAGAPPAIFYPVKVGAETARYFKGAATLTLETPTGAVEVRPMPSSGKEMAFAVAVYNKGSGPANFGIENISITINGLPVAIPSKDELVAKAERDARRSKIGVAILTGLIAGAASTASSEGAYHGYVHTPRGTYSRTIYWKDDSIGIFGAAAAVGGGALVISGIDRRLDHTVDTLGRDILQTTTVDPHNSFGGLVTMPLGRADHLPLDIRIAISWNGQSYPFGLRLARPDEAAPQQFSATPLTAALPSNPQQPMAGAPPFPR